MRLSPVKAISFSVAMVFMTVVCSILWGLFITDKLYHCTDGVIPGYLMPGSWVHGNFAYVRVIDIHDTMSQPDSIKDGWSEGALWLIWATAFVLSLAVSARFARRVSPELSRLSGAEKIE